MIIRLTVLFVLILSKSATAETIKIPVGQQHQELQQLEKPRRGQKMPQVEREFGAPIQRYSARGEPPIARWEYPGFIVYFEGQHVIHSVIKHRKQVDE